MDYLFEVELDIDDSKQTLIVEESCMENVENIISDYAYEHVGCRWKILSIKRIGTKASVGNKTGKEFNNVFRIN